MGSGDMTQVFEPAKIFFGLEIPRLCSKRSEGARVTHPGSLRLTQPLSETILVVRNKLLRLQLGDDVSKVADDVFENSLCRTIVTR
jgi:hypothetical protein